MNSALPCDKVKTTGGCMGDIRVPTLAAFHFQMQYGSCCRADHFWATEISQRPLIGITVNATVGIILIKQVILHDSLHCFKEFFDHVTGYLY